MKSSNANIVLRMKGSGLSFEGLYQYVNRIKGVDISRYGLYRVLCGKDVPSLGLYRDIDCALAAAEGVRNKRLFPLSDERGI